MPEMEYSAQLHNTNKIEPKAKEAGTPVGVCLIQKEQQTQT